MKATKTRAYLIATALAVLVVPALAAVLGFDSHIVLADTITPGNTNFTASLCSGTKVTIVLRNGTTTAATVTCTASSTGGTTPGSSSGAGNPVCGSVSAPTLTGCTASIGNFGNFATTCTAAGSWNLCVTPTTAKLTGGTVTCTTTVLGQHCTAASGAVTLNGTWSNSSSSSNFTNQSVSVTTSGGFPCPSGNNALFSADYCTSPSLTVSDP